MRAVIVFNTYRLFEKSKGVTGVFMSTLSGVYTRTETWKCGLDDVDNRIINHPQCHCSSVKNQFPKLLK